MKVKATFCAIALLTLTATGCSIALPQSNTPKAPPAAPLPIVPNPNPSPYPTGVPIAPVNPGFNLEKVKYAGAAIFEGGTGDPWMDEAGRRHQPLWRLTLCLSRTDTKDTKESGEVALDLEQLSAAYERTGEYGNERLLNLTIQYSYKARILQAAGAAGPFAWGEIEFNSKSQQMWEWDTPQSRQDADKYQPDPLKLFNLKWFKNTLTGRSQALYDVGSTKYYLSSTIERFLLPPGGQAQDIKMNTECEQRDEPYFLQVGSELSQPQN